MSIVRWTGNGAPTIFRDLLGLQDEMSRYVDDWDLGTGVGYPRTNVWVLEDSVVLDAELPGVDPKAVEISLEGRSLRLAGHCEIEEPKEGETPCRSERVGGKFSRTFTLPYDVESAKVKAKYENGLLRITLPRAESDKPRSISIQAA